MNDYTPDETAFSTLNITSPSQLQEVTLDPSLSSTVSFAALRSPEKTSPMRGRSVKEFEEMLSQLKKENFNLKLRIYFLEERLGSMSGTDKEQLTREVVELKVELEALRKEKDEKEDLLLQASRLVELTDKQHQEQLQEKDQEIKDLRSKLQQLEAVKDDSDLIQFEDSMVAVAEERRLELEKLAEQVRQLEEGVRQERGRAGGLEEACRESRRQAEALQEQLEELSRRLEGREAELQAARDQVDSLKSQVKRSSKLCLSPSKKRHSPEGAEQKVTPLRTQEQQNAVAVQKENEDLTKKLKKLDENYKKSCMTIQSFMKRTTDLAQELEKSRLEGWEKDKHVESLGRQLEALRVKLVEASRAKQPAGSGFLAAPCLAEEEKLWAEIENNNQPVSQLVKDQVMARLELEKQIKSLMESLKQKEHQLSEYENRLASATSVIREKDNKILELQKEIAALKETVSSLQEDKRSFDKKAREENESEKALVTEGHVSTDELKEELEAKTKEIAKLNVELKKKNNNLQELVNKELWSKNREIEKLQHRVNSICENKDVEIMSLQQEVTARDFQVKVLLDKMADLGVHTSLPSALTFRDVFQDLDGVDLREQVRSVLEERLYLCQRVGELEDQLRNTPERDDSHLLPLLRGELAKAKEDAAQAEVWRCEAVDACTILTKRLEELARFLNSLLSRGCFLGGLGRKRRQLLKQAVESSMELSRTINMSICGSNASDSQMNSLSSCLTSLSYNVSLADMWDESWLEDCFEDSSCNPGSPVASPCGVNASYRMSEDDHNVQLIARLRSEVETLKQELIQRNKEMTQAEKEGASTETEPQQQSASIAGKQPECNVSFASITFYNSQHSNAPNCLRDGVSSADLKSPKRLSPRNSKKQAVLPQMDGCAQLRKCDLLNRSNKIRRSSSASAVALSQLQQHDGCLSDSEAWSEPDRNVSLARMGLCEDRAKVACRSPLRLSLDNSRDVESSDSSDDAAESGEGMRSPGRQDGRVETELRRLRSRMRGLEQVNDSLRAELNTFCRWATEHTRGDGACAVGKLDKSTSIECLAEGAVSLQAPSQILEQVCHQREKLEALLLHNDAIRHQMEGIMTVMEGKSGSPTVAPPPDNVKGIASQLEEALSRNRQLEQELEAARDGLQEERNEGLEQQCALLEAQNAGQQACLELEQRVLELETQLGEARLVAELSAQEEELARSRLLQANKNVEEANRRLEQMERMYAGRESAAKAEAERKLCELEKRADELEVAMEKQRQEFERREREAQEMLKVREEEWSRECAQACEALEGQLDEARGRASGLALERTRLDNEKVHLEQAVRLQGAREAELLKEKRRLEGEVADLQHQLDTQVSALTFQKSELEQEIQQFKAVNLDLQQNLSKLRHSEMKQFSSNHSEHNSEQVSGLFLDKASSRSSGLDTGDFSSLDCHSASQVSLPPRLFRQRSEMSDYVSEDQTADECGTVITQLCDRQGNMWVTVSGQQRGGSSKEQTLSRVVNASPDLGIESDAGRLSSMEVAPAFETTGDQGTLRRDHARLEQENAELKRRLVRTRRTLEETVAQLTAANQRKKLMEKAICKQLCKTHHVLKTTRCHLEAAQDQ